MAHVVSTSTELRELIDPSRTVAFVPTMGALHQGHLALVKKAKQLADQVVVSIFVNPLQFGQGEDFDSYPRSLDKDAGLLDPEVIVFAPSVEAVYPEGKDATPVVSAGAVGELFEGKSRPGHFDGMLTVVSRLFTLVQPDVAVFGQKDAQQVFLVRKLVEDKKLPIELVVVPTVREENGLALSSRNVYLNAEERNAAVCIPQAIAVLRQEIAKTNTARALEAARRVIESQPLVRLDYLELVDPTTFLPVESNYVGAATVIVAAKVGTTRLIDTENLEIVHA